MRLNLAMFLLAAGTVAGCASNPPPPAPIASAPEPAPMPAAEPAVMSMDGVYKGTAEAVGRLGRGCARPGAVSTTVRRNVFVLKGIRGRVSADGTVHNASRRGGMLTGTLSNGTMDVTTKAGRCSYHIVANHG